MMWWAADYVGIPFLFGGLDRDGCDCWGLARMILSERFGCSLPAFDRDEDQAALAEITDAARATLEAEPIESPEPGDIVLATIHGHPSHVGIVVGDGCMLHTLAEHGSVIERYATPRWAHRIKGFYRVR